MSLLDGDFRPGSDSGRSRTRPHGNLGVLRLTVIVLFAILAARLGQMQIVNGEDYSRRARENHIRTENILPARGLILDRNGMPLVKNVGVYSATLVPELLPELPENRYQVYLWIEENLGVPALEVQSRVKEAEDSGRPDRAITVARSLTQQQALTLDEASVGMPGLRLEVTPGREYIAGNSFSHILGYIGAQSPDDARRLAKEGYAFNEPVGKAGIEASYESDLRGKIGYSANEQDAYGRLIDVLEASDPEPGNTLRLAIDAGLQDFTAELLTNSLGEASTAAAVVMNAKTGEVYALVSVPTYDNNIFADPRRIGEYNALATDTVRKPFLNRALFVEAPGSTFKLITSAAALQEGLITPETWLDVPSKVRYVTDENGEQFPLIDWAAHGGINLYGAIANSSNIYMFMSSCGFLGETRGLGRTIEDSAYKLANYAKLFGLGAPTGIDIEGEWEGRIPTPEWKRRNYAGPEWDEGARQWYYSDTCYSAIGQGDVLASPLQIARMTAAVANGGKLVTPHIAKDVIDQDGNVVRTIKTETKDVPVNPSYLEVIRDGMLQSVTVGAGKLAAQPGMNIAGKTGTAEFKVDGQTKEHAWFTGFYPYEDPEIVVTVYYDLGWGGGKAAPTAGQILRYFDENVAK